MIADLLQSVACGIAGGLTVRGLSAWLASGNGPEVVRVTRIAGLTVGELVPGALVEEEGGRRWVVVRRTIDDPNGARARLSIDLTEEP